jgi:pyruvate dehydrogenase E2 component (dihydrolipoamide acetyltransferase)
MAIEVKLPNLGEGVDTGDVLELLVKEGDIVAKDQGIIELETGKATLQVPSSAAGKVAKIHVQPGQTIPAGTLLLTLEAAEAKEATGQGTGDRGQEKTAVSHPKKGAREPAPRVKEQAPVVQATSAADQRRDKAAGVPTQPQPAAQIPPQHESVPVPPAPKKTPAAAIEQPLAPAQSSSPSSVAAGPAVRRFAREVGVDLSRVTGTGTGGRITRDDVLAVVRQSSQTAAAGAKPTTATARDAWGPIRPEKLTKIRKTIAAKMHESWTTCPRVTNFDDADVTELERLRVSSKDDYAKKAIKLTSLPFVIKAVASALKQHRMINASLDLEHEQVIYKEYVNIGIAVDTERGLVVPSLRGAEEMSIPDIARAVAQLSENVREGNFTTADLQGSTFTISNLGAIGGTYSTPIINTPEVAILLVGRSRKLPVIVDDEITVRLMMPLSLAYDHRLVDGATAARFLNDVIDYLEAPSRLLLAP